MVFTKDNFKSNLYETSKSKDEEQKALLNKREASVEVYDFDEVKKWFCKEVRNNHLLRSCDVFYENHAKGNYLVIEFKNAHHLKTKSYMGEVGEKLIDTHMILKETFYPNKKNSFFSEKVRAIVVYNDSKNSYGTGVVTINNVLSSMQPIKGDKTRETEDEVFSEENEYIRLRNSIIDCYKGHFYADVDFMDKEEFYEMYINVRTPYFEKL